jgi:hypothetical protein
MESHTVHHDATLALPAVGPSPRFTPMDSASALDGSSAIEAVVSVVVATDSPASGGNAVTFNSTENVGFLDPVQNGFDMWQVRTSVIAGKKKLADAIGRDECKTKIFRLQ